MEIVAERAAAWEEVQKDKVRYTLRQKVPGGWLYLVTEHGEYGPGLGQLIFQNLVFVPATPSAAAAD